MPSTWIVRRDFLNLADLAAVEARDQLSASHILFPVLNLLSAHDVGVLRREFIEGDMEYSNRSLSFAMSGSERRLTMRIGPIRCRFAGRCRRRPPRRCEAVMGSKLSKLFSWFPELGKFYGASSAKEFDEFLELHFARSIQRMEAEAHHLADDSEESCRRF
ncbi:hypothetical protein NP590_03835 [Methylomonas sp. SURF-2]|uniref:Uncharacterized protein n=1 Tax=Methylomonas subterranea TaxID=2952225 RepID=A0ABT1TCP2_9GAMM|nr:hypothetical protein [Methylomonas sp. SURF-2]MCQ8103227.1 hypothetical protein [Methylomonas sp. SURF-2]